MNHPAPAGAHHCVARPQQRPSAARPKMLSDGGRHTRRAQSRVCRAWSKPLHGAKRVSHACYGLSESLSKSLQLQKSADPLQVPGVSAVRPVPHSALARPGCEWGCGTAANPLTLLFSTTVLHALPLVATPGGGWTRGATKSLPSKRDLSCFEEVEWAVAQVRARSSMT